MSRTTRNINRITKELDRISGLDGIVADKLEKLADEVHNMVEDILRNNSEANLFDYEGNNVKTKYTKNVSEIEIKHATAIYTGGNLYIYYGQLTDGYYFRAYDEWDCIEICDSDTSVEEADYIEFYESHTVKVLSNKEYEMFWDKMLTWIINNKPEGNYSIYELENRL